MLSRHSPGTAVNLCLSRLKWLAFSKTCIKLPVNKDVIRLIDRPFGSFLSILFG